MTTLASDDVPTPHTLGDVIEIGIAAVERMCARGFGASAMLDMAAYFVAVIADENGVDRSEVAWEVLRRSKGLVRTPDAAGDA